MSKAKDIQTITLDFSGIKSMQTVTAKQGDDKSRCIRIKPISNGEILDLSNSKSVDFRCLKPDGTSTIYPVVKENDGTILVELSEQTLAVPGNVKADIVIAGADGEILSSSVFIVRVEPAATNGNYIPSKSEEKRQADFDMDGHTVTNLAEPVNNSDATTKIYVDNAVSSVDFSGTVKQYSSYYDVETLNTARKTVEGLQETGSVGGLSMMSRTGYHSAVLDVRIVFGVQPHALSYPDGFIPFFSNSPNGDSVNEALYIGMPYADKYQWFTIQDLIADTVIAAFGKDAVKITEEFWNPSDYNWSDKLGACTYHYRADISTAGDINLIEALKEMVSSLNSMIENNMIKLRFDWQEIVNLNVKEAVLL